MSNKTKPVHTVLVRVKVIADTKEEAENLTTTLMTEGVKVANCDLSTFATVKHWQIKK